MVSAAPFRVGHVSRLSEGDVFAGYTIERQLGAGGMGEVYLARHPRLPRHDALKILAAPLADNEHFRARFEREADLVAGLRHPSIVGVYDRGEADGRLWIAFQYIDGPDLAAVAGRGPMPLDQVDRAITEVADALDDAGARGLVHRDVKPANILIDEKGRALLTDFGIAHGRNEAHQLTGTGVTMGTVAYSSPEQLQAQPVDARADQYSLACTAFMLLTGTVPYDAATPTAIILAHVRDDIPSITARRPGLPITLDAVFARALAKNPADRYPSSREFAAALHHGLTSASQAPPTAIPQPAPVATRPVTPAPVPAQNPATQNPSAQNPSAQYEPTRFNTPPPSDGPRPRRKTLAYALIAVAAVALLVGGTFVAITQFSGDDDPDEPTSSWATASADARDLERDPVGPALPSLDEQPKEALWSFSPPGSTSSFVSAKAVGGTDEYALIGDREYKSGTSTAVLYVVDAKSGKHVRTLRFPGSGNNVQDCQNLKTENRVVCRISGSGRSSTQFAIIDAASGDIKRFTATGDTVRTTGDVALVASSSSRTDGDLTAFDVDGKRLWSTSNLIGSPPPSGSPVVAESRGQVFRLRDVATGKTLYTRDASKALDSSQPTDVTWAPFRGGFAVQVGKPDNFRVELYDAEGKRTATVEKGWSIVPYSTAGTMSATPLPVLTNEGTDKTATVDPATGTPALTVSLEYHAAQIEGAVGTKVAVSYQSPSASTTSGGSSGYAYAWFDAYQATAGHFGFARPEILGTDGTNLLVASDSKVHALAPERESAAWTISLKNDYGLISAGGRLYDGNRRLI